MRPVKERNITVVIPWFLYLRLYNRKLLINLLKERKLFHRYR